MAIPTTCKPFGFVSKDLFCINFGIHCIGEEISSMIWVDWAITIYSLWCYERQCVIYHSTYVGFKILTRV
jgi:hypothetical protein